MTTALTTDAATQDPARAVRFTLFWGLDGVVLRTIGGARVPDVNEGPLRRRLDEADLPVLALDPGLFEGAAVDRAVWLNDVDRLADVAPFAARVRCGLVRVGALAAGEGNRELAAEALRAAGVEAERLGLRLSVRNEAHSAVATGAALAALLHEVGHPAVGADWRPVDAWIAGEAPDDGLAALAAAGVAVASVSARDGRREDGGWHETAVGEGGFPWDAHLVALAAAGAEGPLVIDALPAPARTAGLTSATALIQSARRAVRAAKQG